MKKLSILSFLLFLYIFISAQGYVMAISNNLSNSVFRLHVIANSNTTEDQTLKLKVRDNLLTYMNKISSNCSTKQEAIKIANEHINEFKTIAENTITDNGYNYSVSVTIDNSYFPTKSYGDISLPAGYYDALRVKIGEAKGQNWWCVMFPSLCFVDISSGIVDDDAKENLKENLEDESYSLISDVNKTNFKFKFKLVEFFAEKGLFEVAQTNK